MPNFHLTETTELFQTNLFSELESLLKKEIPFHYQLAKSHKQKTKELELI